MTDATFTALLDEKAITRLLHRYVALNDGADYEGLVALFTPDGKLVRPTAPNAPIQGRDAILAAMRARPARKARHLVCNVEIDVLDASRARARSTMVLITATEAGNNISVGGFDDELEKQGGEWLFSSRTGTTSI